MSETARRAEARGSGNGRVGEREGRCCCWNGASGGWRRLLWLGVNVHGHGRAVGVIEGGA